MSMSVVTMRTATNVLMATVPWTSTASTMDLASVPQTLIVTTRMVFATCPLPMIHPHVLIVTEENVKEDALLLVATVSIVLTLTQPAALTMCVAVERALSVTCLTGCAI